MGIEQRKPDAEIKATKDKKEETGKKASENEVNDEKAIDIDFTDIPPIINENSIDDESFYGNDEDRIAKYLSLYDIKSQEIIPREFYGLETNTQTQTQSDNKKEGSSDSDYNEAKRYRFGIKKELLEVAEYRDEFEKLNKSFGERKILADHLEGLGYDEPIPVVDLTGLPNSEVLKDNAATYMQDSKKIKMELITSFLEKYSNSISNNFLEAIEKKQCGWKRKKGDTALKTSNTKEIKEIK